MKIAMLVSGGVDSSVALKLLKDAGHDPVKSRKNGTTGHDVTAFYLKIWLEDETAFLGTCPWEEDLRYVRAVCKQLDVPLKVVPLQKEYHARVVAYALDEVRAGRTPNPDVLCNSFIKFGAFLEWLECKGGRSRKDEDVHATRFDKIATGHYARIRERRTRLRESATDGQAANSEQKNGKDGLLTTNYQLLTSPDRVKDQTYFLSRLSGDQLARAMFPIGEYTKEQVREMARKFDLPTKDRPDSQGLCFLGEINYSDFVRHHLGEKEGDIINQENGEVIGRHKGYWFHTIGQRHGLDLSGGPWYVVDKDVSKNIVYVSHRLKMHKMERKEFKVSDLHSLASALSPLHSHLCTVKVRHGAREYPCELTLDGDKGHVKLLEDVERGIAPGQFAVFYDGEVCLGSGIISE